MCGIAGLLNFSSSLKEPVPLLKRMLGRIEYRGPDESGIYVDNNVCLGSVRLSILDITTGQQPLSNNKKTHWIVFNGEIFNYIELRNDLIKKGYSFQTSGDTEVLLLLYSHYGKECLNMLNGQFAFAIWDATKQQLFLARDRVGIRPLFYVFKNGLFIFGSEIKTLFEHPEIKAELNIESLAQVFTFWTTITPNTIFKEIKELPPAHYMKINSSGSEINRFWSLNFPENKEDYFEGSLQEAGEELDRLLTDAVKLRLRSDVPVAAYLSGGIDSSATTAYLKKINPGNFKTFSIGFEDQEFDERDYQEKVSKFIGTEHTGFTCSNEDIGRYFPKLIWHSEIPVLRTAPVPMYCLSKEVRDQNIKVVITGEGADEILAGYDIFKEAVIRYFWSRQPDSKYRHLLLTRLYPYMHQFKGKNPQLFKFFYGYKLNETDSPYYSHLLRWHNTSSLLSYLSPETESLLNNYNPISDLNHLLPQNFNRWERLSKSQWLETIIFMSGYLLSTQGDRVSMANSVEGRYPFLDYRVIEFCSRLSTDFKMKGLKEKYILKKIMQNKLPDTVINRPKQAYRAPVYESFFSPSNISLTNHLLSENVVKETGIFDSKKISGLLKNMKGKTKTTEIENMSLTGIISTHILYNQYVSKMDFRAEISELKNCRIIYQDNFQETN